MSVSALPIDTGRDDRDRELVETLRRRDADAAERLVTTISCGLRRFVSKTTWRGFSKASQTAPEMTYCRSQSISLARWQPSNGVSAFRSTLVDKAQHTRERLRSTESSPSP
jgi:hypothetical protein